MTEFAYGTNEIGHTPDSVGCHCPATAAGFDPGGILIVGKYDRVLSRENGEPRGVVPEDRAKEVWLEAIENSPEGVSTRKARRVAKKLGWLDD